MDAVISPIRASAARPRRRGLRLTRRLSRLSIFYLSAMMADDTPCRGAQHGMMTRHMTHNTADGGTFQATLGAAHARQQRHRCGDGNTQQ
jgi:hypothetical protein